MKIDFNILNTKEKFLSFMKDSLEDMYALNYDALIDAITSYQSLEIEFINIESYQDYQNLIEVIEIINNDYPNIKIKK